MDTSCSVCQDTYKFPITLKCNHKFCFFCIKNVKETAGICPLCRATIEDDLTSVTLAQVQPSVAVAPAAATTDEYPCVNWFYGSNDKRTWWYYDEYDSKRIEEFYSERDGDSSDDDSDKTYEIQIGAYAYEIDFENMRQIRNNKWRKILRMEFQNPDEKKDFEKNNVRGIIGIKF